MRNAALTTALVALAIFLGSGVGAIPMSETAVQARDECEAVRRAWSGSGDLILALPASRIQIIMRCIMLTATAIVLVVMLGEVSIALPLEKRSCRNRRELAGEIDLGSRTVYEPLCSGGGDPGSY
ncbi:hypothetical protein DFP72DRAFT_1076238 [Ephemerocybe angulata]|uniref:Uncharacterized protein n=1 Tax=Ephemerocybe angulata TaxID=980116 RepID=A0A8H6HHN7_9AGAR|nr:hypothetical protein DFP72DRAFT_1076238 [Tulosesus angulatus]